MAVLPSNLGLTLLLSIVVQSCLQAGVRGAAEAGEQQVWGYDSTRGPSQWGNLKTEFSTCGTGTMQSPVNFGTGMASAKNAPKLNMPAFTNMEVLAEPTEIKYNITSADAEQKNRVLEVNGEKLVQKQFHFHTPSEHRINSMWFDGEIHMVFNGESGKTAVLGLLVQATDEKTPDWDAAIAAVPKEKGGKSQLQTFDAQKAAQSALAGNFFMYSGSLTTPPCSEGVQWYVAETPVKINRQQLAAVSDKTGFTSRYTQFNRDIAARMGTQARFEDTAVASLNAKAGAIKAGAAPSHRAALGGPAALALGLAVASTFMF